MATKKTTKSNKTSHVLNLLTSAPVPEEGGEVSGSTQGTASANASSGAGITLDPNMLSDFHEAAKKTKEAAEHFDGAVSNFQSAVENFDVKEEQLKEEHKKEVQKEEQLKENLHKEELNRALEEEVKAETTEKEEPASLPSYKKSKITVIDESSENDKITNEIQLNLEKKLLAEYDEPEPEFHIVNVMLDILKTKDVRGLIQKHGGCTCDKCIADVTALSLTQLPAKYVVLDKDKTSPMIGFYQSKFQSDIFVAMLKAVLEVKMHPHHDPNRGRDTTKFDAEERKNLKNSQGIA
jgi:hypothetical protein